MTFVFKWYHPTRNQWYRNKLKTWDEVEIRLNNLMKFGITQIKWIQADLE